MAHVDNDLPVIPAPRSWAPEEGVFPLGPLAEKFNDGLSPAQGADRLHFTLDGNLAPDNYRLEITPTGILISAADDSGLGHALTTLRQMAAGAETLPCGLIEDGPRFGWRGLLLDCGRHFMPVEVIKGVIDRLAMYKFNVLHWHLTEDQGWRLEIPDYPRLTEVGAWRIGPDGKRYGGFYTADDVAEVLEYAAARHIRVVPEIEMPGHALAALAAYPELACTGGPFEVETQWGIHEDVFCAGREETFTFLEDVLIRVMELFPGEYLHIGGDEVPKDRWRDCPHCQARIEKEGLAGEDELQSWFIARIERFLDAHGRRLIGWDEILEGGLAERTGRAVVQAWRGHHKATVAARSGLDVIVSPTSHAYLDYDPSKLDLARVFSFQPIPDELRGDERGRILGGAVNLWTEYVPPARVDTMLFPRMAAMAEALWTADENRDFFDFWQRWRAHQPVRDLLGAAMGPEARPLSIRGRLEGDRYHLEIEIEKETRQAFRGHDLQVARGLVPPGGPIGFEPGERSEEWNLPTLDAADVGHGSWDFATSSATTLAQAQLLVDGIPYGAPELLEISSHLALGREPDLGRAPSRRHPGGGPAGLTDGLRGGRDHEDGRWSGFEGSDFTAVLDLGELQKVRTISTRFLQDASAWILLPCSVIAAWSTDGEYWTDLQPSGHDVPDRVQDVVIREFTFELGGVTARYLRVKASNFGELPDWHPGRGQPSWIFVDEIAVR